MSTSKTQQSNSPTKNYLIYGGSVLLLFILIILYVLEYSHFSRTFNVGWLVAASIVAGIALGTFLGYRFRHRAEDLTERIQIYAFFIIICAVFMPLFGHLTNRLLAFRSMERQQAELFKAETYVSSRFGLIEGEAPEPTGHNVYFIYDNELHKITTEELWFSDAEQGDIIPLPIQKGLWGFSFVKID